MRHRCTDRANPWQLTPREEEVIRTVCASDGLLKAVAIDLGISIKTVDTLLGRAKNRMGARTRFAAILLWDRWARLNRGIAKEAARAVLPEGMTESVLYMAGSIRSWIHYCQLRTAPGTQKEHREVAEECQSILLDQFPALFEVLV